MCPGDDRVGIPGAQFFGGKVDAVGIKAFQHLLVALVSVLAEFLQRGLQRGRIRVHEKSKYMNFMVLKAAGHLNAGHHLQPQLCSGLHGRVNSGRGIVVCKRDG